MGDKNATHPIVTAEDPVLAAHEAAEWDDEPYTEEERAAVEEARSQILRGEYDSLENVRRRLLGDDVSVSVEPR